MMRKWKQVRNQGFNLNQIFLENWGGKQLLIPYRPPIQYRKSSAIENVQKNRKYPIQKPLLFKINNHK